MIPGFAFPGRKILKGVCRRQGGAAASGCCMVDTGAGPELRLRSGQGQAKGRTAPGGGGERSSHNK